MIKSRLVLVVGLASLALFACKRESEPASDPRPPAEAPPPPPAPNLPPPEGEPEEPAAQAEQAPADAAPEGGAPAEPTISPEAQAEADQLWTTLCSTCHGPNGEGDGPVAASFPVKPRSFKDKEWQAQTSDETIAKVIVEGGAAIGKSPLMPANPQLTGKPEVVQALVKKVRELGK
ncbi:MAG: c-type cytochrome [Pseudomonadota bacterium]|nr:MAG: hypothetical protein DIU72_07515 [Pseudomonadota bacterium]